MSKAITILSPGRTGTSLMAGILHEMGVNMSIQKVRKSGNNIWGTYESAEFVDFNEDLMREMGYKWHLKEIGWQDNDFPTEEGIMEYFPAFKERAKKLIDKYKKDYFGWKDVRTIHSYPILFKFAPNPHIVVSKRKDRQRHMNSLGKISSIKSEEIVSDMIDNYYNRVNQIKGYPRQDFFFEDFIYNTEETIRELADFIGYRATDKQIKKACNHIGKKQVKGEKERKSYQC